MKPGDIVYLRAGIYHERLRLARSGTRAAPILFTAYPGERPILDGAGLDVRRYDALVRLDRVSDIRLAGIEIRNSPHVGLAVNNPRRIVLDGLEVHHCGASGIMLIGAGKRSDSRVVHCRVHDCRQGGIVLRHDSGGYFTIARNQVWNNLGIDNFDGIEISDTPYVAVLENIVHDNAPRKGKPEGDQIDAGGTNALVSPSHHLIYQGNLVYGRGGWVKMNNEPLDSIIRRNIILDTGFCFYEGPARIAVYQNTIVNPRIAVQFWGNGKQEDFGGPRVLDNLFVRARGYTVHIGHKAVAAPPSIFLDGNLYAFLPGNPRGFCLNAADIDATFPATAAGLAAFSRRTGQEKHARLATQTPERLFQNPARRDFRLRAGADAIDAGIPLTTVRTVQSPTEFTVECSWFFQDGWNGLLEPDTIQIRRRRTRVFAVDYRNHRIRVQTPVSVRPGTPVSLPFAGAAPDAGAFETALEKKPQPANAAPLWRKHHARSGRLEQ